MVLHSHYVTVWTIQLIWSITVHICLFQYGIFILTFKYDLILIAQDVESEEKASTTEDASSSTVDKEDKEFSANEEDGK